MTSAPQRTAAPATVRTVLGDIPADELGVCDSHDHLFFRSLRFPAEEVMDDVAAATAELRSYAELGGRTLVQWTPFGLGRRPARLAQVSRATGVHVVAATGLHQEAHYPPGVVRRALEDGLTELFVRELTEGMADPRSEAEADADSEADPSRGTDAGTAPAAAPVRAGMIKVAGAFHVLDAHARTVMAAAAAAHHATGAPIGVHLEHGTAGADVLDLLCDHLSVPPDRVLLGHLNRFPESRLHRDLADRGAFLSFDGPSPANQATDWRLLDALNHLLKAGHAGQLLLGGDTTTARARASTGGGPGVPYLLRRLRPSLEREFGPAVAEQLLVANPARAFAVRWPGGKPAGMPAENT
ncbi:phosphotriesterase [Streptacidiphilus sp. P02-A3a]|uniref:phosphotriesterase family protein n=1 Tax=Streptacidiphilus sp. P02-A3a TaxID=2704468 RepID=UPI0015FC64DE|nr:phosphotriesterase [Streptacidiphilus sp. P02-A3a]QMU73188.1 phosphotriesterase [Streptacidiphilus sp. P02-A3a]